MHMAAGNIVFADQHTARLAIATLGTPLLPEDAPDGIGEPLACMQLHLSTILLALALPSLGLQLEQAELALMPATMSASQRHACRLSHSSHEWG